MKRRLHNVLVVASRLLCTAVVLWVRSWLVGRYCSTPGGRAESFRWKVGPGTCVLRRPTCRRRPGRVRAVGPGREGGERAAGDAGVDGLQRRLGFVYGRDTRPGPSVASTRNWSAPACNADGEPHLAVLVRAVLGHLARGASRGTAPAPTARAAARRGMACAPGAATTCGRRRGGARVRDGRGKFGGTRFGKT